MTTDAWAHHPDDQPDDVQRRCLSSDDCPSVDTHRRLRAAHRLWHQTQAGYADPEGFCVNLNACIQALRSVTWVLQKAKRRIPNFDEWYPTWQQKLREDPVMRWLVESRNQIEKQGDLDTKSTVGVQILSSYREAAVHEFNAHPLWSIEEIALHLGSHNVPQELQQDGILVVERRWVVDDLPDVELLDTLAYAYGVLSELFSDAHVQVGLPPTQVYNRDRTGEFHLVDIPEEHLRGRLPCMLDTDTNRTVHVKLSNGRIGAIRRHHLPRADPAAAAEVLQRYGHDASMPSEARPKNLREEVDSLLEFAKNVLRADGHHSLMVILKCPDGTGRLVQLTPEDRAEKYLLWELVAKEVDALGADGVIVISEAWYAPFDASHPNRPAVDSPDRREVLAIDGIDANGHEESVVVEFRREQSDIAYGESLRPRGRSFYLDPIRRVWRRTE